MLFILSIIFLTIAAVMAIVDLVMGMKNKRNPGVYPPHHKNIVTWIYLITFITSGILSICDRLCYEPNS